MVTRVISGIVLAILTVISLVCGGPVLFFVCFAISLIGLFEFYKVFKIHKTKMGIIGYCAAALFYLCVYFNKAEYMLLLLVCMIVMLMTVYVMQFPKYRAHNFMETFFGVFYVVVMLSYIYQTRVMENGLYIVWLIFICSWGSDTCAYFTGVLIGKHKMTPKLSPKKTWEGFFGGIFGAAAIGAIYGAIINNFMEFSFDSMLVFALAGAAGAAFSVVGDLAASGIKREQDVKDYGKIIPGHGGILDRFDSVIFTAPAVFWIVSVFL